MEHALPEDRCTCTACGAPLVQIGEETSEQLDYQPASLFVIEHVRFTYACQACEGTVVTAELPAAPIEKGERRQHERPSGRGCPAPGSRHRDIICHSQTLAAQEPDATGAKAT